MPEPNEINNEGNGLEEQIGQTSSPSVKPKGFSLRRAGNTVVKTTGKVTRKVMEIFAAMPLPVKIAVLAVIALIIIVLVIMKASADQTADQYTSSVDKVINESKDLSEEAKEAFNNSGSLIKIPVLKLLEIYDYYMNKGDFSGSSIKDNYSYILGTKEVEIKEGHGAITSASDLGYDVNLNVGSGGKDKKRVEFITGSTADLSTYKSGGFYTLSNGKIGSATVEISTVTINVWTANGTTATKTLQVNKKLEKVVESIFKDIYNDPSHPIIETVGCCRNSDKYPGHPFAVAIDINCDQNPDTQDYPGVYDPENDSRSMGPDHPIVKIFKEKYGWDWRRRLEFQKRLYAF